MIEQYMLWVWLGVFIIALVVEAVTQDLVSIWFSAGAFVSLILSIIDGIPYWVEIIVFVVVSCLTLLLTRPVVKKMLKNQIRQTNADEFIGQKVVALKPISKDAAGEVKINDVIYQAIIADENSINAFEECQIVAIKGNKLVVKQIRKEI